MTRDLADIFTQGEAMIAANSLQRLIAEAQVLAGGAHPCSVLGHQWVMIGGAWAGCCDDCVCSVAVHECRACGDCDYGDPGRDHLAAYCEKKA